MVMLTEFRKMQKELENKLIIIDSSLFKNDTGVVGLDEKCRELYLSKD